MSRLPLLIALSISLMAAALLAGCGGGDEPRPEQQPDEAVSGAERGVLETIDALQTASRTGDGNTICGDIFTPHLARSVESAAKRTCAEEVREELFSPEAELSVGRDIRVNGAKATATVREQNGRVSKLFMVRRNGRWQIDRVVPQRA